MSQNRKPTEEELRLIKFLMNKSKLNFSLNLENKLLVCPMEDGGMGSLYLIPNIDKESKKRFFGKQIIDFQFIDLDGVNVLVALNLDKEGELFELDIWKTDFSRLIKIPDPKDFDM